MAIVSDSSRRCEVRGNQFGSRGQAGIAAAPHVLGGVQPVMEPYRNATVFEGAHVHATSPTTAAASDRVAFFSREAGIIRIFQRTHTWYWMASLSPEAEFRERVQSAGGRSDMAGVLGVSPLWKCV